jgi:hypothetical protein
MGMELSVADTPSGGRSGGVNIQGGTVNTGGGDIFGGDKITTYGLNRALENELNPLAAAITAACPDKRAQALAKLDELRNELAKGEGRDDGLVARLIDAIAGLAPAAVSVVAGVFSSPLLSAIAGPITKSVLEKLQSK